MGYQGKFSGEQIDERLTNAGDIPDMKSDIATLLSNVGKPNVVTDASDFATADHSKVYAYMGETTANYTHEHWYYYKNGAWTDGGVWGSAVPVDAELETEGAAADAKATGGAIGELKSALNNTDYVDYAETLQATAFSRGTLRPDGTTSDFNKESRVYNTDPILFPYGGKINTPAYINIYDYTTNTALISSTIIGRNIEIPVGANIRFQLTTTPNTNTPNSTENITSGLNIEKYNFAIEKIKTEINNIKDAFNTGLLTTPVNGYTLGYRHSGSSVVSSTNTAVTNSPVSLKEGDTLTIATGYKLFWCYQNGQYPSGSEWHTDEYVFPESANVYLELRKIDNSDLVEQVNVLDSVVTINASIGFLDADAYVATSGDDNNFGGKDSPFATITHAIESGASRVHIFGGVYTETIDMAKAKGSVVLLNEEPTKAVLIKAPENVIATQAEIYSESIYSVAFATAIVSDNLWLYQENTPDAETLISDQERMPQQRGKEYRCADTRIVKCTATTLSDAIAEMQSADNYKWFKDGNTVYFTCPVEPSESCPICYSPGGNLFINMPARMQIIAYGIDTKYHSFNVSNTVGSHIEHCSSGNVYGAGAFAYDRCSGVSFVSCEAYRTNNNTQGDGFNGHGVNSGDVYAHQVTALIQDCWSHDNCDDGYSDHEHSEVVIRGGLFEYNGKGGVTPSYGSHCVCYNVYSRNNYAGFFYVGTVDSAEGGKYGQVICYGCIADHNTRGGTRTGFRCGGAGNTMKLYNCLSINNGFAVGTEQSGGRIHVYGLKTGGNEQNIDGYATRIDIIESATFSK